MLIAPGEAWLEGLPFNMRSARDPLVSGATLTLGIAPAGTSITDSATGLGKVVTFTVSTTSTASYDIFLSAQAIVTKFTDVPFLRNQNLTEATADKIRIEYRINIVNHGIQNYTTTSPFVHYGDENSAAPIYNLFNEYKITPDVAFTTGGNAGNATVNAINPLTPSQLDGSNVEVILWNRDFSDISGSYLAPLPVGTTSDQLAYYDGTLVDSYGSSYHIVSMSLHSISSSNDGIRLVLDKEIGNSLSQPDPQIVSGVPFKIIKRDLYYGDSSGNLLGKRHLLSAKATWNITDGFVHDSVVKDKRKVAYSNVEFNNTILEKADILVVGGQVATFNPISQLASWTSNFILVDPHGTIQTIPLAFAAMTDNGSLVYELNLTAGGNIARGTIPVTVTSVVVNTAYVSSVSLSSVRLGNILKLGSDIVVITAIDDVNDVITFSGSLSGTGVANIYLDSFALGYAPLNINSFTLASRNGNNVVFTDYLSTISFDIAQVLTSTESIMIISGSPINVQAGSVVIDSSGNILLA